MNLISHRNVNTTFRKPAIPCQCVVDDSLKIIEAGLPFKNRMRALASTDDACRIARAPILELYPEINARNALYRFDHFEYGKPTTITAIDRGRSATAAEVVECVTMCGDEVRNMDIVSDAGPVWRRIVGSKDIYMRSKTESRLDRNLDEVGSSLCRLTRSS